MNRLRPLFLTCIACAFACACDLTTIGMANVPPPAHMLIDGNGSRDFLGFTNVYLTRRAERTVPIRIAFISAVDDEGEPLHFFWYQDDAIVSELQLHTNEY